MLRRLGKQGGHWATLLGTSPPPSPAQKVVAPPPPPPLSASPPPSPSTSAVSDRTFRFAEDDSDEGGKTADEFDSDGMPDLTDGSDDDAAGMALTESESEEDEEEGRQRSPAAEPPQLTCDGRALGHNVRPASDLPNNWPVYEAYCLNVLQETLDPGAPGSKKTWGKFKGTRFAGASKRLLYFLLWSVQRALDGPAGCDPLVDLEPADSPPQVRANRKWALEQEYRNGNPHGTVERPPGIGEARRPDDIPDPSLVDLKNMISTIRRGGDVTAQTTRGGDNNIFVYCDRSRDRPRQVIMRRVSVFLEELLTREGGETIGWRWWVMVHDPRILLPRWMARVIDENQALETARQRRRDRALEGMRINVRALSAPIDAIDTPGCYRAIRSVHDYAKVVREYYAGVRGRFQPGVPVPQEDTAAVGYGMHAPATSLHPCRVFSPTVAMTLHIHEQVCPVQTSLDMYEGFDSQVLGAFPRAARATCYNVLQLTPVTLESMALPQTTVRGAIISYLILKGLRENSARLPSDLADAVLSDDSVRASNAMAVWEQMDSDACQEILEMVNHNLSEDIIESFELGAIRNGNRFVPEEEEEGEEGGEVHRDVGGDFQAMNDHDDDDDDEPLDFGDGGTPLSRAGHEMNVWLNIQYDPEGTVNPVLFDHLKQREETGSSISTKDIQRSPLLHLRMCNLFTRDHMQAAYTPNTPMYRSVMADFRQQSFKNFWDTLETYQDDESRLSGPLRGALRKIRQLNQHPNYIRRHYKAIYGDDDAEDDDDDDMGLSRNGRSLHQSRAQLRQSQQNDLFAAALYRGAQRAGGRNSGANLTASRRGFRVDTQEPKAGTTLWHEWPYAGGWNLSAYGSWRASMRHRAVQFFRCRPGAGPDLLHRLLLAQGTAWTYRWGLHGDQLMWGPGGVGKSYMLMCIAKQAFAGQVEFLDHLTERCFAVDEDMNDLLILIEELNPRFVGQDEKGNPVSGDELLKTLMARHCVNTTMVHITEEGKRVRMRSIARSMITIFGATNLVIRMHRSGQLPAILRRWMMDHVSWGTDEVPLAAITNPLSMERNTPEQIAFYHEMAVTNALCLLVEKMIEVGILFDVDVNICSVHLSNFFEQVHKQCQVPKASDSIQQMLIQLCRQTCIRYAVHRVFFSETAADTVRCRLKQGGRRDRPEDWEPARFVPETLLEVQPFLVVTEEMMADVLTTTRSTYMPTISWGVADVVAGLAKTMTDSFRVVTKRVLRYNQEDEAGEEGNQAGRKRKRTRASHQQQRQQAAVAETDQADPMVCLYGTAAPPAAWHGPREEADGAQVRDAVEMIAEDLDAVCNDENYIAFRKPDFRAACDYFSQMSKGTIGSMVFEQVLLQWKKQWFRHKDRNRPQRDAGGVEVQGPDGERLYPHVITSPLVVIEPVPEENGSGWGGGGSSRRSRGADRRGYVQICILAEYLEKDRHSDINEILRQCLSYRGARTRDIVSADGVRITKPVRDTWAGSHESEGTDQMSSADRPRVVVREYLGTIPVKSRSANRLYRVNHFAESDVTDSLVYNRSLNRSGTAGLGFSDARNNPSRLHQVYFGKDLDELFISEYWHRVGWEVNPENYPWNYTEKLRQLVRSGQDHTGTPTSSSNLIKERYPDDYVQPSPPSPAQQEGLSDFVLLDRGSTDLLCGDDRTRDGCDSAPEPDGDVVMHTDPAGDGANKSRPRHIPGMPMDDQLAIYMRQQRTRARGSR